ncbi:MAG: GxxExxY protein [Phycisphaerales bacterium]
MTSVEVLESAMRHSELPAEIQSLSHRIIGAAIEVHREMGPGLLEKLYEDGLVYELGLAKVRVDRQYELPMTYKGVVIRNHSSSSSSACHTFWRCTVPSSCRMSVPPGCLSGFSSTSMCPC